MKSLSAAFFVALFLLLFSQPAQQDDVDSADRQQQEEDLKKLSNLAYVCPREEDEAAAQAHQKLAPQVKRPKNGDERGEHQLAPRAKREVVTAAVLSTLVVSNLISVLTGSLTNDLTASSTWDKITFCYKTIFKLERPGGWKLCWEYWRLGEHRWRKALKPHLIAQIHRIAVEKLHQMDPGQQHYKAALLQIQEEFNALLLDGDQAMRLINLMNSANIPLVDLNSNRKMSPSPPPSPFQQQQQIGAGDLASKMVRLGLHETGLRFSNALRGCTEVLTILRSAFHAHISGIQIQIRKFLKTNEANGRKAPKAIDDLPLEILDKSGIALDPSVLERIAGADGSKLHMGVRYLHKVVKWMVAELRRRSDANQLFLHATLAVYAQQMLGSLPPEMNQQNVTMGINADNLSGLAFCLLRLMRKPGNDGGDGGEPLEYGPFEGRMPEEMKNSKESVKQILKWLKGQDQAVYELFLLKVAVRKQLDAIQASFIDDTDEEYQKMAADFGRLLFRKYEPLLESAASPSAHVSRVMLGVQAARKKGTGTYRAGNANGNGNCQFAAKLLLIGDDWAEVNEKLEARLLNLEEEKDNLLGKTAEKVELDKLASKRSEMAKKVVKQIQSHFFPNHGQLKLHKAMGHDKNEESKLSEEEKQKLLRLLMAAKLATLGHILSLDLETHQKHLKRAAFMLDMDELALADVKLATQFRGIAERLMDKFYEMVNFRPGFLSELGYAMIWLRGLMSFRCEVKDDATKRRNKRDKALEAMAEQMRGWLDISHMEDSFPMEEEGSSSSTLALGVPMRLSAEMIESWLKQAEYAKAVKLEDAIIPKSREFRISAMKKPQRRRRKKRLIDAFISGLVTGWLGNWFSQHVDLSLTLKNWFLRFNPNIVSSDNVLRKRREKTIFNFIERSYKILLAKVVELDRSVEKVEMKNLLDEMGRFLVSALHGQGVIGPHEGMDEGNILLRLQILSNDDFRRHIEQLADEEGQQQQRESDVLRVIREFRRRNWIGDADCRKHFEQMMMRLMKKQCQKEVEDRLSGRYQMDADGVANLMDNHWHLGNDFNCHSKLMSDGDDEKQ